MSFAYKGMTHCKECGKALDMNEFGICSYCKEKMNNKTNIEEDVKELNIITTTIRDILKKDVKATDR